MICWGGSAALAAHPPKIGSADVRAERTLKRMTAQERQNLLLGYVPFFVPESQRPKILGAGFVPGLKRVGIPDLVETDASLGVANMGGVMRAGDGATALPSGAAMASTWNPELIERAGAMIGSEARAKGFNVLLGGGVNLVREPRNGRNFEYLGEDPLLAGTLAGRAIRGVQSNAIISTIKHYALNAQETGRGALSANMDEAALRESDLLAFEIGIEIGKPGAVMCAYNQVNGIYACENGFLLNEVLRRDWDYRGFVMSDWGAVHSTASLRKGLDQESGTNPSKASSPGKPKAWFGDRISEAIGSGQLSSADVNRAARRVLRTIYACGLADNPPTPGQPIAYELHARLAQQVAESGMVLLKNERGLLPIPDSAKRILLVGAHADVGVLGGGGSSQVWPASGAALAIQIPNTFITHKRLYMPSSPLAALKERLPSAEILYDDGTDLARAVDAAHQADLVIVFGEQFMREGIDAVTLDLPDGQDNLIDAVATANQNTVVVLETGGPVAMPWLDKVGAVLEAWYPGQRGGHALVRILTGDANPAGRLPMTFPASLNQTPNPTLPGSDLPKGADGALFELSDGTHFPVHYPEGSNVGYRWYDRTKIKPLFAFGYGLSYTQFDYSDLKITGGRGLSVSFRLVNVGARAGAEVAQVYVRVRGVKRLIGWSRIDLPMGASRRVTVGAEPRLLASFDVKARAWRVAAGTYNVEVGSAADAPKLIGETRLNARRLKP
jgi:beta-glucosidase